MAIDYKHYTPSAYAYLAAKRTVIAAAAPYAAITYAAAPYYVSGVADAVARADALATGDFDAPMRAGTTRLERHFNPEAPPHVP